VRHLERHEPAIWRGILAFYAASKRPERPVVSEALGERVLAPVCGPWRRGEVLALGTGAPTIGLQDAGRRFLADLLGPDGSPAGG
jgi:hypothetical protein